MLWPKKKDSKQDAVSVRQSAIPQTRHIDEAERVLDSREGPEIIDERTPLSKENILVAEGWEHEVTPEKKMARKRATQWSFIKILLLSAGVFFLASAAFFGYVFYRQSNLISTENVMLLVGAPLSVGGGEELPIEITLENTNPTGIQSATLLVTFPQGTRNADDREVSLVRFRDVVGDIASGERVSRTVKAALYGGEKEVQRISVELTYRVPGSNAIFSKKKDIDVELSASPISLTIATLREVSANQLFEIVATLTSNSKSVVDDVLLEVEYPFGFSFVSADPSPFGSGNNLWNVGDMSPGDKRTVRIRGTLAGQNDDARAFRFGLGRADVVDPRKIDTVFVSRVEEVAIKKSFISLDIGFDGVVTPSEEYSFSGGRPVSVNVRWQNNLDTRIADAVIEIKVSGASLDRPTIRPTRGHYRSIDDTIVFDRATDPTFALLNPGDSGASSFSFSFIPPARAADAFLQNQEIVFEASVRGRRMSGDVAIESLQNTVSKRVKVSSDPAVSSRISYSNSPITNWGPIPPKADQPTRYTVTWTVTNTFNATTDAVVTSATLPTYVRWTGVTYPPSEDIKLQENGFIVWKIGEVQSYAGYVSSPRQVSFQVELLPSITQIGSAPILTRPAELSTIDRFTGARLTSTANGVNTVISTDPIYQRGYELVIP